MIDIEASNLSFFGEHKLFLSNSSNLRSILKKKCFSVSHHFVREGVEKDEWMSPHINTKFNLPNMHKNSMPRRDMCQSFTNCMLRHVHNDSTEKQVSFQMMTHFLLFVHHFLLKMDLSCGCFLS